MLYHLLLLQVQKECCRLVDMLQLLLAENCTHNLDADLGCEVIDCRSAHDLGHVLIQIAFHLVDFYVGPLHLLQVETNILSRDTLQTQVLQ